MVRVAARGASDPITMIALRRPGSTRAPRRTGDLWRNVPLSVAAGAREATFRGAVRSPYGGDGPQIGRARAGRLSRRCRGARDRRAREPALLPRRPVRALDVDQGDRAVAQLLVEAAYDGGREQAQLDRPGGGVGAHDELAVGERLRGGVRRDLGADQLGPAAEDGLDLRSTSQPRSATSRSRVGRPAAGHGRRARAREPASAPVCGDADGPGRPRRRGTRPAAWASDRADQAREVEAVVVVARDL